MSSDKETLFGWMIALTFLSIIFTVAVVTDHYVTDNAFEMVLGRVIDLPAKSCGEMEETCKEIGERALFGDTMETACNGLVSVYKLMFDLVITIPATALRESVIFLKEVAFGTDVCYFILIKS